MNNRGRGNGRPRDVAPAGNDPADEWVDVDVPPITRLAEGDSIIGYLLGVRRAMSDYGEFRIAELSRDDGALIAIVPSARCYRALRRLPLGALVRIQRVGRDGQYWDDRVQVSKRPGLAPDDPRIIGWDDEASAAPADAADAAQDRIPF